MKTTRYDTITARLTYSGSLPFILCLIFSVSEIKLESFSWPGFFISYSVIIACFMAGTLWGLCLDRPYERKTLWLSNALTLMAWGALGLFYLGHMQATLLILTCIFAALLVIEHQLDSIPINYRRLRLRISLIVITAHIAMIIVSI